jgi:hypothetical protein
MTAKLGSIIPTMYVTSKIAGDVKTPMKINTADFNPAIHAKVGEEAAVVPKAEIKPESEPEPKPKAEPKAKPKAK